MAYTSPPRTLHSCQVTHFPERICITYTHRDKLQKPWPDAEVETLSDSHRIEKRVSHSSFSVSVSYLVLLKHIEMTVTISQDGYLLFKIIIFLVHMFGLPDSQETENASSELQSQSICHDAELHRTQAHVK